MQPEKITQRSFRLQQTTVDQLQQVAERLAKADRRAPNQTTALAWCIVRGLEAIEAREKGIQSVSPRFTEDLETVRRAVDRIMGTQMLAENEWRERSSQLEKLQTRCKALETEYEKANGKPYQSPEEIKPQNTYYRTG